MLKKIPGHKVIEELKISPAELLELIKDGLQAYTDSGDKVYDQDGLNDSNTDGEKIREEDRRGPTQDQRREAYIKWTINEIRKKRVASWDNVDDVSEFPKGTYGISFRIPNNPDGQKTFFSELLSLNFLQEDIDYFKIPLGDFGRSQEGIEQSEKSLVKRGHYWEINYKGRVIQLQNQKRLRYLIALLENPGKEFTPYDLMRMVEGENLEKWTQWEQIEETPKERNGYIYEGESIKDKTDTDLFYDRFEPFWKKFQKIKRSGNPAEIQKAQKNWDDLKAKSLPHGVVVIDTEDTLKIICKSNSSRRSGAEKMRVNITKHIKNALSDLKSHFPPLHSYLNARIKTGSKCSFTEDPEKGWIVKQ